MRLAKSLCGPTGIVGSLAWRFSGGELVAMGFMDWEDLCFEVFWRTEAAGTLNGLLPGADGAELPKVPFLVEGIGCDGAGFVDDVVPFRSEGVEKPPKGAGEDLLAKTDGWLVSPFVVVF